MSRLCSRNINAAFQPADARRRTGQALELRHCHGTLGLLAFRLQQDKTHIKCVLWCAGLQVLARHAMGQVRLAMRAHSARVEAIAWHPSQPWATRCKSKLGALRHVAAGPETSLLSMRRVFRRPPQALHACCVHACRLAASTFGYYSSEVSRSQL